MLGPGAGGAPSATIPGGEGALKDGEPCYSARLLRPWLTALRRYPGVPQAVLAQIEGTDPDDRIPAAAMIELARGAVELTGDPDIGLRAAQAAEMGDYDVLEYAASSASTVKEAAAILMRYVALVNDGIEVTLDFDGGLVRTKIASEVELNRAAADFQLAAFYVAAKRTLGDALVLREIWHRHAQPANLEGYREVYGDDAVLRFAEPREGFVVESDVVELELPAADPKLHHVLRRHAEQLLANLPKVQTTGTRVRNAILETLSSGQVSAESVARQLHMSRRTMTRRLEEEGTSYKELLDGVRRQLAVGYLTETSMGVGEVAFLLGFSQGPAFHRAFKRWTGQTPIEFRNTRRG